jgi:hypothetical protein
MIQNHIVIGNLGGVIEVHIYDGGSGVSNAGVPLQYYDIYFYAPNPADTVVGVDFAITGPGGADAGPTAPYQVGYWHAVPALRTLTPDMAIAQFLVDQVSDSHFMLDLGLNDWSDGNAVPNEMNDFSVIAADGNGEGHGFGSLWTPAGFISAHAQAQDLYIAHVTVVPPVTGVLMFAHGPAGGVSNAAGSLFPLAGLPIGPVPEPATLSLLVLGGLALIRRRR